MIFRLATLLAVLVAAPLVLAAPVPDDLEGALIFTICISIPSPKHSISIPQMSRTWQSSSRMRSMETAKEVHSAETQFLGGPSTRTSRCGAPQSRPGATRMVHLKLQTYGAYESLSPSTTKFRTRMMLGPLEDSGTLCLSLRFAFSPDGFDSHWIGGINSRRLAGQAEGTWEVRKNSIWG